MNSNLETRLHCLANHLESLPHTLAFLALGSAAESERMDEFSDLDFFLITEEGYAQSFIESLDWLSTCAPLSYTFRNTIDGYKIMWEDGIYAEFAVFNPSQLSTIPFTQGRFIFNKEGNTLSHKPNVPYPQLTQSIDYAFEEIVTNLYVGLSRYHRGEKLSAFRLIQVHAVDRYVAMMDHFTPSNPAQPDPFALERRVEKRYPSMATWADLMLGYDQSIESAMKMIEHLERIKPMNPTLKSEILKLIQLKRA